MVLTREVVMEEPEMSDEEEDDVFGSEQGNLR